jgi:hypothetical protein
LAGTIHLHARTVIWRPDLYGIGGCRRCRCVCDRSYGNSFTAELSS